MHSASRLIRVDSSLVPASCLFAALNELLRAVDGRVVLLRPLTACFDSQRDDLDLLLTGPQREQLLLAAFLHCTSGQIHCRIQQSSPTKAQLILWTIDCSQKLMIDLWTSFDQLPRHRHSCIPADRLLNTLTAAVPGMDADESDAGCADQKIPALRQLSPDIDLCLLIQHLATKRRNLTTSTERGRIARACERLASWSQEPTIHQVPSDLWAALCDIADQLPRAITLTPQHIALSEDYLLQRLACVQINRGLPIIERRSRRGLITGLRKAILRHRPTVAVIGSDGAGKSSVVSTLASQQTQTTAAVAKKLYRRSLTYLAVSGLMKRVVGTDRGKFDDHTAPLITLRAAAVFWINMCFPFDLGSMTRPSVAVANNLVLCDKWIDGWPGLEGASPKPRGFLRSAQSSPGHPIYQSKSDRGQVSDQQFNKSPHIAVLDRSISSFLITHRKSDMPKLSHAATWIESFVPPVTSVLLTLPHSELARRKQEMSAPGHTMYQRMLFEQALRQQPTDLLLLANLPSAQAAATAICELLLSETRAVESSTATADSRKAAA